MTLGLKAFVVLLAVGLVAAVTPTDVRRSSNQKRNIYLREGLVVGGDRMVSEVIVMGIRQGRNEAYDRIVLDLVGNVGGEAATIERPPYYQVAMDPVKNRLTVTLYGRPSLAFDGNGVRKALAKSRFVKDVELFPVLEKDRWTFALRLMEGRSVEIFDLADPVRVVLDIR